jgi:hypothetical protein
MTAAFSYLLFVQKFELMPPFVRSTNFSKILLRQADDARHIAEFFQAYRHLCDVLGSRGYRYPPVRAIEGNLAQPLYAEPFPVDVEEAIQGYKSA